MQKTGNRALFRVVSLLFVGAFFLVGALIWAYPGYAMNKTDRTPLAANRALKLHDENLQIATEDGFRTLSDRAVQLPAAQVGKFTVKGLNAPVTVKAANNKVTVTKLRDQSASEAAMFEVRGLAEGQCELIIEDSKGNQVKLQVTVTAPPGK